METIMTCIFNFKSFQHITVLVEAMKFLSNLTLPLSDHMSFKHMSLTKNALIKKMTWNFEQAFPSINCLFYWMKGKWRWFVSACPFVLYTHYCPRLKHHQYIASESLCKHVSQNEAPALIKLTDINRSLSNSLICCMNWCTNEHTAR